MIKPDNRHVTRYAGTSYNEAETGANICRVAYGVLSDVFAHNRCNYSYREFWF